MKSVLIIASTLMALSAEGKTTVPADSLKISKDISLDEVVVTATKVAKGTPVAYSELTKDELNRRNDGQGIPFLILQSPSVIMTSDAGTGIGYSGFRIRGTDANRINITVNGVPINDSESHTVFWVNMPDFASSVDNIQIQRGADLDQRGSRLRSNRRHADAEIGVETLCRIFGLGRIVRDSQEHCQARNRASTGPFRFRCPLFQYPERRIHRPSQGQHALLLCFGGLLRRQHADSLPDFRQHREDLPGMDRRPFLSAGFRPHLQPLRGI